MQLLFKVNACAMDNHAHVCVLWVHFGTRWRLHTPSQRGQWCGAVSAIQNETTECKR